MDKKKLKEVYDSIRDEVENMRKGGVSDFGVGSYQDGTKIVTVEREYFDSDTGKIFYVNGYSMTSIPHITAIVYRAIIDEVTEYGTNHNFF